MTKLVGDMRTAETTATGGRVPVAGLPSPLPHVGEISVIVPVKNEAANIERLLHGLVTQTRAPSEIVITDGGSTDGTRELIRRFAARSVVSIVLIEVEQSMPGRGRNLAISRAAHEWVAAIDAGIVPRADWLAELARAAEQAPGARVVWGGYAARVDNYFIECAAITYLPPPGTPTRSVASCLLRREAWAAAGGFPEDLRSGEDLLFFRGLARAEVAETFATQAVVDWELQPTLALTFRRFAVYSLNGMRAGLAGDWQVNVARLYGVLAIALVAGLVWWWPLALLPPFVWLLRAERRLARWFRRQGTRRLLIEMLNPRRVFTVAWINMVIDLAAFVGVWRWLARDYALKKLKRSTK